MGDIYLYNKNIEERRVETTMQQFSYKQLEDESFCVTGYEGDEAEVVIPSVIAGQPVTMLFDNIFKGHTEITSVTIPDTVSFLGGFVFDGCTNLHQIILPDALVDIWQYAFVRSSFEELRLPDGVKYIPPFAFKDCKELRKIQFGKGLKKVYGMAFQGCDKLENPVFDDGVDVSPKAFD